LFVDVESLPLQCFIDDDDDDDISISPSVSLSLFTFSSSESKSIVFPYLFPGEKENISHL
jgi:hypothetical protein